MTSVNRVAATRGQEKNTQISKGEREIPRRKTTLASLSGVPERSGSDDGDDGDLD